MNLKSISGHAIIELDEQKSVHEQNGIHLALCEHSKADEAGSTRTGVLRDVSAEALADEPRMVVGRRVLLRMTPAREFKHDGAEGTLIAVPVSLKALKDCRCEARVIGVFDEE